MTNTFLLHLLLLTGLAGAGVPALAMQAAPAPQAVPTGTEVQGVDVAGDTLDSYAGTYVIGPGFEIAVWREGERLMLRATGQDAWPLIAESEAVFTVPSMDTRVSFGVDARGRADHLVLYMQGKETRAVRRP